MGGKPPIKKGGFHFGIKNNASKIKNHDVTNNNIHD